MAARIDNGRVQLLTRTGLDWIGKLANLAQAAITNDSGFRNSCRPTAVI
jgi:ATP-dependent DNA ligase